jgi:exoribonuclease II
MNLFFEESGDFKVGAVLSQQGEAYQVETPTGKRTKVRARDVLLQFETPSAADMIASAHRLAEEIDVAFLWEVAGENEFGVAELGNEYFGHAPKPDESAGLLLKIAASPIYFHKKGKGRYKAAPAATLQAALAGIEKKKQQALLQQAMVEQLKAGQLPDAIRASARQLLTKPDKNGIEYKALDAACTELQTSPARLLLSVGAIASAKDLHLSRFLTEHFPRGTEFPGMTLPSAPSLPLAAVAAFSIDDVTTTEIDDAFSLTHLSDTSVRIGIHIAAPGLGITQGDAIDSMARGRMSTVYMPGDKITMLPDALVEQFTLAAGDARPALSLYATLDTQTWSVLATETLIERVPIAANLRHNDLDAHVTEQALAEGSGDYPYKDEITRLWQWAQQLELARMAKREAFGLRPEQVNRVDFNFYVDDDVVTITRRKRGAPLDKIVAELMIFANSTWGKLMHDHGVPGIYRAQGGGQGWASRMQVRMQTHAAPHQGLGVDQYAWSTSPLRRYTDLVNQWQIVACVRGGVTAPLVAPFKPKDADLFAIVSAFDSAYAAYAEFQATMERFWCLRWLAQHEIKQVDAVMLKDDLLRLLDIPLVIPMTGVRYARGTQLRLELIDWDEVDLSVQARVLEVVTVAAPLADEIALEEADALNEEEQAAEQVADLSGDVTDQAVAESMIDSSAELHAGAAAQGLTLPAEGPAIDTSASDRA